MALVGKITPLSIFRLFVSEDGTSYPIVSEDLHKLISERLRLYPFSIIRGFSSYQVHGIPAKATIEPNETGQLTVVALDFNYGYRIVREYEKHPTMWWNGLDPMRNRYALSQDEINAKWMTQVEANQMISRLDQFWKFADGDLKIVSPIVLASMG